jgi:PPOX class probable F420-dependent enzyme
MPYLRIIGVIVVGIVLGLLSQQATAEEKAKNTMAAAASEKMTARASRDTREGKSFTAADAEFLQRPLASQLVTVNPSGTPQLTVMWFRYEDGSLLFTTTTDRIKFRNQQKDARAVFSVVDPTSMYKWIVVHGKLSVDNREPAAFYRGLADHYLAGDALEAWRKTAVMDKRTVLRLTPTKVRTMGVAQK